MDEEQREGSLEAESRRVRQERPQGNTLSNMASMGLPGGDDKQVDGA